MMILVDNDTKDIIISANIIELFDNHAIADGRTYFCGITPQTHSIYVVDLPNGMAKGEVTYAPGEGFLYKAGVVDAKNQKLLEKAKAEKLRELKKQFETESNKPVSVLGSLWNGGIQSAFTINGLAELKLYRGKADSTIHDFNNLPHTLDVNQIKGVAAEIADAYQAAYVNYQAKKVAVSNATTVAEVEAITW